MFEMFPKLAFVFQNPLVILVVLFGMSCTMGLAVIIPVVANVILAVFGGWMGDLAQSQAKGTPPDSAGPDDRPDFPKQVVGFEPGHEPSKGAPAAQAVQVEPDTVPTGMLARLAIGVTIVAMVAVIAAVQLFDATKASQLAEKGYSTDVSVVPYTAAK